MEYTNLNIRTSKETKAQAERIFEELGISTSTAFNMFLKAVIRENGIPFDLSITTPSKEMLEAMNEIQDMKAHPDKYPSYSSVEELRMALGV